MYLGFPGSSTGKKSACNEEDLGLIPGLRRSPGEGNSYSLQYFDLENSMAYTVAKSWTTERLSLSLFMKSSSVCQVVDALAGMLLLPLTDVKN